MEKFEQTIHGKIPSKSNSYKIINICGHSSLGKANALKDYEKSFYMQCNIREKMITGYFRLDVDVYHENMRPDLDNSFKILLDMLQSCRIIKNDRQCVEIHARKLIDKKDPRIEFVLEEVEL